MDEQEQYDRQRRKMRNTAVDLVRMAIDEKGLWPAAVVAGFVAAAGQLAHEQNMDQQELWRAIMEDLCRDQGVDPSVLSQPPGNDQG